MKTYDVFFANHNTGRADRVEAVDMEWVEINVERARRGVLESLGAAESATFHGETGLSASVVCVSEGES